MALDMDQMRSRAGRATDGFSRGQLVTAGLLGAVALIALFTFARWVTAPTYAVAATGLTAADAAAVTTRLAESGTPYRLEGGGSTVLVPADRLDATRVDLGAAGLPESADAGWEVLDEQGLTSSSLQQRVAVQRAMEGEIARTLASLQGVTSATVHLAVPEDSVFTEEREQARASVFLETAGSADREQVASVVNLVASAVPGLDPDQVTVDDSAGRLLASPSGGMSGSGAMGERQSFEDSLSARATSMLEQMIGPGSAVVRVAVELEPSTTSSESETYDPEATATLRSTETVEEYEGADPTAEGVVARPDEPDSVVVEGEGGAYTRSETTGEFGVSRTVTRQETPSGQAVRRMTVAVALDRDAADTAGAGDVGALVAQSVGLDETRGDLLTLELADFGGAAEQAEQAAGPLDGAAGALLPTVVAVLVLLGVVVGLVRAARTKTVEIDDAELAAAGRPAALAAGAGTALPAARPSPAAAVQPSPAASVGTVPGPRAAASPAVVAAEVESDVDGATRLMRSWLTETTPSTRV